MKIVFYSLKISYIDLIQLNLKINYEK